VSFERGPQKGPPVLVGSVTSVAAIAEPEGRNSTGIAGGQETIGMVEVASLAAKAEAIELAKRMAT
jgi:hypothetical protein